MDLGPVRVHAVHTLQSSPAETGAYFREGRLARVHASGQGGGPGTPLLKTHIYYAAYLAGVPAGRKVVNSPRKFIFHDDTGPKIEVAAVVVFEKVDLEVILTDAVDSEKAA